MKQLSSNRRLQQSQFFAPVCVSVQRGLMPGLIIWAFGLATLGWLVNRARWGGLVTQLGRLPVAQTTGVLTPGWEEPSFNSGLDLPDETRQGKNHKTQPKNKLSHYRVIIINYIKTLQCV